MPGTITGAFEQLGPGQIDHMSDRAPEPAAISKIDVRPQANGNPTGVKSG